MNTGDGRILRLAFELGELLPKIFDSSTVLA